MNRVAELEGVIREVLVSPEKDLALSDSQL
jgi:hypothetical protein